MYKDYLTLTLGFLVFVSFSTSIIRNFLSFDAEWVSKRSSIGSQMGGALTVIMFTLGNLAFWGESVQWCIHVFQDTAHHGFTQASTAVSLLVLAVLYCRLCISYWQYAEQQHEVFRHNNETASP